MLCNNCGKIIDNNESIFCPWCGYKVNNNSVDIQHKNDYAKNINIIYDKNGKVKISGWLTAISCILGICMASFIISIIRSYITYSKVVEHGLITSLIKGLLCYEGMTSLILLSYAVYVSTLFVERKKYFKKSFIILLLSSICIDILEILYLSIFNPQYLHLISPKYIFVTAIHIIFLPIIYLYLKRSRRVYLTFSHQENEHDVQKTNIEINKNTYYIPSHQKMICPECGKDIFRSTSYCPFCNTFISRESVSDYDSQKKISRATTFEEEFVPEISKDDFNKLRELSPRAATMALEKSAVGEDIRKRLQTRGVSDARDRADVIAILRKLSLVETE